MTQEQLARRIVASAASGRRFFAGIAGPPGAGKTTLAAALKREIDRLAPDAACAVVPMDGFHLDNATLDRLGLRQRKGAPETFDAEGFVSLLRTIREGAGDIAIPGFDRERDAVIPAAAILPDNARIIIAEGNYLLLRDDPWNRIAPLLDLSVMTDPGMAELERRLVRRWLDHGHEPAAARARALTNDIPNARRVIADSAAADIRI